MYFGVFIIFFKMRMIQALSQNAALSLEPCVSSTTIIAFKI